MKPSAIESHHPQQLQCYLAWKILLNEWKKHTDSCQNTRNHLLFCFPMQNFTEIGQSAAELWLTNDF